MGRQIGNVETFSVIIIMNVGHERQCGQVPRPLLLVL